MRTALLCLALTSCSPFTRVALKRCPALPPLLADTMVTGVGLALAVDAANDGRPMQAVAFATTGMIVALAANISECR
jgi:hypothetical protein